MSVKQISQFSSVSASTAPGDENSNERNINKNIVKKSFLNYLSMILCAVKNSEILLIFIFSRKEKKKHRNIKEDKKKKILFQEIIICGFFLSQLIDSRSHNIRGKVVRQLNVFIFALNHYFIWVILINNMLI